MRWGIRNQILLPFAAVLLTGVTLTAFSSAWLSARRSEREVGARFNRVMTTLRQSSFPYSQNVLEMMQGLSGAEFVVLDAGGTPLAATLPEDFNYGILQELKPDEAAALPLNQRSVCETGGVRYFMAGYRRINPQGQAETLFALYPEDRLTAARREAALPPLVIGGITLLALFVVSALLASRLGRRIGRIQQQVAGIAAGHFAQMQPASLRDELGELVESVNTMSRRLQEQQQTIQQTERSRLLGQLAGGLAHQLRNAVTGAKLAIQLHRRRCRSTEDAESLDVALRQLSLTEEHLKGLLSVGKPERRKRTSRPLQKLLDDVAALVAPVCRHEHVRFSCQNTAGDVLLNDAEALQTAVLNLLLNAVEAAGPHGSVSLVARRLSPEDKPAVEIVVADNGPGPPADLQDRLFEPFVTGKPEGVGLGLALVQRVAQELAGSVQWQREKEQTIFRLTVPAAVPAGSSAEELSSAVGSGERHVSGVAVPSSAP